MGLDEDSGLKNYFKEIVKNANKFGEKIDLSHYKNFVEQYNDHSASNKRPPTSLVQVE